MKIIEKFNSRTTNGGKNKDQLFNKLENLKKDYKKALGNNAHEMNEEVNEIERIRKLNKLKLDMDIQLSKLKITNYNLESRLMRRQLGLPEPE